MTFLLDVNVLIALIDSGHVAHEDAHRWFEAEGGRSWATCPITENGVIRIVGHPKYPDSPGSPALIAPILSVMRDLPGHQFWVEDVSILDSALVDASKLFTPAQVTDSYLLALAVKYGGRLATFDRRLSAAAVRGGRGALHVIGASQ